MSKREMTVGEHMIMTVVVLVVIIGFIFMGGCTHVRHSDDPAFTYPRDVG